MNIKEHIEFLKIADWEDVTEALLELEQQRFYLKDDLTKKELKELDAIIGLYEQQRAGVLHEISVGGGFGRTINMEIQGVEETEFDIGGLDDDL